MSTIDSSPRRATLLRDAALDVPPVLIDALRSHLASMSELLTALDDASYQAAPIRTSGSVGQHVRHSLDHARALVSAVQDERLTYDTRLRGTAMETERAAAIEEIARLCDDLAAIEDIDLNRPIELQTITHRDAPPTTVRSTVGRELAFVIQHTIHHGALIAALLDRVGVAVPPQFGYAPSTPVRR